MLDGLKLHFPSILNRDLVNQFIKNAKMMFKILVARKKYDHQTVLQLSCLSILSVQKLD